MAEGDDSQEKTEEPTQKRKDQAREEGRVVTSNEVFVFATLSMGTLLFLVGRPSLPGLTGDWAAGLSISPGTDLDMLMLERTSGALVWVILAGLVVGIPMIFAILMSQAAMGGLNFAPKALGFKPDKINPLNGIKRMVSMKAIVDLLKSVLKVVVLLGAGAVMVEPYFPALEGAASMEAGDAIALFGTVVLRVLSGLLVGLVLIASVDLGWQIYSNSKSLRMSRQDIKDEMKESEGSPEVKGQIRRRQIEASRRAAERKALGDVPQATAIITNPTHFAVALKYDPASGKAPEIIAMGKNGMAREVIKRGRRAGVATLRLPPLARALYFTGGIGREIPEQLYAAVAVVLAHVWRIDHGQYEPTPDVDLPPELRLDEYGRQEKGKRR